MIQTWISPLAPSQSRCCQGHALWFPRTLVGGCIGELSATHLTTYKNLAQLSSNTFPHQQHSCFNDEEWMVQPKQQDSKSDQQPTDSNALECCRVKENHMGSVFEEFRFKVQDAPKAKARVTTKIVTTYLTCTKVSS